MVLIREKIAFRIEDTLFAICGLHNLTADIPLQHKVILHMVKWIYTMFKPTVSTYTLAYPHKYIFHYYYIVIFPLRTWRMIKQIK